MNIVRLDAVGAVSLRLVSRPTNTAIGVDNFHFYATGKAGVWKIPQVRFFGTSRVAAERYYDQALNAAYNIAEELR